MANLKKYQQPKRVNNSWDKTQICNFLNKLAVNSNTDDNNDEGEVNGNLSVQPLDNARRNFFDNLKQLWNQCTIPEAWRIVKVCPIPKKGKDPALIDNYRPMCLLSVLLKTIEYMIKEIIENEQKSLPERSYAYRKNHSTVNCINDIINSIQRAKIRGFHV